MKLANSEFGYLFWIVPLLIFFFVWAFKSRRKAMEVFAERHLLAEIAYSLNLKKQKLKSLHLSKQIKFLQEKLITMVKL